MSYSDLKMVKSERGGVVLLLFSNFIIGFYRLNNGWDSTC
jgi:hypothetical protein